MQISRSSWLFLATTVAVWLFLFWPFLTGQACFGYRDSAHLYFPLFEWIQSQWSRGELPLWNPLDDFGQPLVAEGVSSVFYPLKVIFFLTALPYPVRFGFFVSIHALIAASGAYFLARRLQLSRAASALSASGFALSGAVLFQSSNVIFFVGAAWLPWAFATGWVALLSAQPRDLAWCAVFIALQILGGDPQSAYHVLLILGAGAFFMTFRIQKTELATTRFASLARFGLIALIAAGLSAVQWLPSWQWQQRSLRANPEAPRSVWESTGELLAGRGFQADAWFRNPIGDTHHDHIYQFSQPPWSLAELVWPNVSGKEFPVFRRWTAAIPGADRVWTPSLYFGLAVLLLAVSAARLCGRSQIAVGLTWLTIFFGLGSLGWYGLGWIAREFGLAFQVAGLDQLSAPIFGVYWWMVTLLPGYGSFRYPAKLFVVATLGASLLAGFQLNQLNHIRAQTVERIAASVFLVSIGLFAFSFWSGLPTFLARIQADSTFGPFDVAGSQADIRRAILHASIVSGLLCLLLRPYRVNPNGHRMATQGIVALALVDLIIANAWLIVSVPCSTFTTRPETVIVEKFPPNQIRPRLRGIRLREAQPVHWAKTSSAQRLEEVIQYQRATLYPKFHLTHNIDLIGSFHSIQPMDLIWFNEFVAEQYDAALAIDYRIRADLTPFGEPAQDRSIPSDAWLEKIIASPRLVFVADWTPHRFSRDVRLRAAQEHEFIAVVQADLSKLIPIDNDTSSSFNQPAAGRAIDPDDQPTATILAESANQLELHVHCPTAGWLVLKDYWDAGWSAEIRDPIAGTQWTVQPERFCGLFRAVEIPQGGKFDVRMTYLPTSFVWGAASSLATLLFVALVVIARAHPAKASRNSPSPRAGTA